MLKITTEGRKAALDLRSMLPACPRRSDSKVNLAVENIHRIWHDTDCRRDAPNWSSATSPRRTGTKAFPFMTICATSCIARGIPADEIAFIQDYDDDTAKARFSRCAQERSASCSAALRKWAQAPTCRSGSSRFIISMRRGVLPTWSSAKAAFSGRAIKTNTCRFTATSPKALSTPTCGRRWRRRRFIAQVMTGDMTMRRLEDLDSAALTYAEVKAIASGNPLVIEKAQVDAEVMRLTRLKKQHAESLYQMRSRIRQPDRQRGNVRTGDRQCPRRFAHPHEHSRGQFLDDRPKGDLHRPR